MKKRELLGLFPTPLLICSYPDDFDEELEWIKKQEVEEDYRGLRNQSKDTFILDNKELGKIRQFIENELYNFKNETLVIEDELVITQSWLNVNGKGASHHYHNHPNSIVSGVWYPQIDEDLPPIKFSDARDKPIDLKYRSFNFFNSETFMLPMNKGELLLFPSHLNHEVPSNQSDEVRISLSFNTWVRGDIGDVANLTYIPFNKVNRVSEQKVVEE